jgi:hypothetical protein
MLFWTIMNYSFKLQAFLFKKMVFGTNGLSTSLQYKLLIFHSFLIVLIFRNRLDGYERICRYTSYGRVEYSCKCVFKGTIS